jgi:glycosyltransferase involved in cell wall biosynthesis
MANISASPYQSELLREINAQFWPIAFERKISLWRDFCSLMQLILLFRREKFDLVHSIMPKTGLLTMVAAWVVGVPIRLHTFTGQVWATKHGGNRQLLKFFDKLIVWFATQIFVDSPSQRDFLVAEGVLSNNQGLVIGNGSICGVDEDKFRADATIRKAVRRELNIAPKDTVILFLGRLNRDKGLLDLARAFTEIASHRSDVIWVLVGAEETVSYLTIQEICDDYRKQLRRVDFTPYPERYMMAADIFCLPSYREGFGQVIIEAAACGVPAVASRIYGISDAVEDGVTGILFPVADITSLTQSLLALISNHAMRQAMGDAARQRALKLFSSHKITAEVVAFYSMLLSRFS